MTTTVTARPRVKFANTNDTTTGSASTIPAEYTSRRSHRIAGLPTDEELLQSPSNNERAPSPPAAREHYDKMCALTEAMDRVAMQLRLQLANRALEDWVADPNRVIKCTRRNKRGVKQQVMFRLPSGEEVVPNFCRLRLNPPKKPQRLRLTPPKKPQRLKLSQPRKPSRIRLAEIAKAALAHLKEQEDAATAGPRDQSDIMIKMEEPEHNDDDNAAAATPDQPDIMIKTAKDEEEMKVGVLIKVEDSDEELVLGFSDSEIADLTSLGAECPDLQQCIEPYAVKEGEPMDCDDDDDNSSDNGYLDFSLDSGDLGDKEDNDNATGTDDDENNDDCDTDTDNDSEDDTDNEDAEDYDEPWFAPIYRWLDSMPELQDAPDMEPEFDCSSKDLESPDMMDTEMDTFSDMYETPSSSDTGEDVEESEESEEE